MQLAAQQARADKAEALLKQVGEMPPAGTHGEKLPQRCLQTGLSLENFGRHARREAAAGLEPSRAFSLLACVAGS